MMSVNDLVNMNITDPAEPLQYGWELKEQTRMPVDSGMTLPQRSKQSISSPAIAMEWRLQQRKMHLQKEYCLCLYRFLWLCGECYNIDVSPPARNYDGNEESEAEIAEFLQAIKIIKILNVRCDLKA